MFRSMMQIVVKHSDEAFELYREAFDARVLCAYPNEGGGYYHAELDAYGQVLALSEQMGDVQPGNTMMFCLHFGEGGAPFVHKAYEVLRRGALSCTVPAACEYSPCQFLVTDKFGVCWCIFE